MTAEVLLGIVIGAQGLRGEVKVKTFTEAPLKIGAYGPLHTGNGRPLPIAALREAKGFVVVRFEGVENREEADALKGAELYVPRTALRQTGAHEFYYADLIGLRAEDTEGRGIGKVIAIHNFGAGDVIEIERGDGEGTVLMPFTREVAPDIDMEGQRIVIAAPEEIEAETKGAVE